MLLRLTSSSLGSLFLIRSSVSSTSVEFGSSSGTGLYCVGLITPGGTNKKQRAWSLALDPGDYERKCGQNLSQMMVAYLGNQQHHGGSLAGGLGGMDSAWTSP